MIEGDEIVVEVFVPAGVSDPAVEIGKVYQGHHGLGPASCNPPTNEGNCEIDVSCSDGNPWSNQILAVGRLTYPTPNVTYCCTGTLLNDTANFHKYFLTAYHCMHNLSIANQNIVYWNFQEPSGTCNNGNGGHASVSLPSTHTQVNTSRAHTASPNAANGDFLLLELAQDPRKDQNYSVYFAGWDARGNAPPGPNPGAPTVVAGIHHPEGNVKALSFSNSQPTPTDWCSSSHTLDNYWSVLWDRGGTEDGSSGSCLFDTKGRCIGQLFGGSSLSLSSCGGGTTCSGSYYSWYGKLSASWTGAQDASLQHWLDPTNIAGCDGPGSTKCNNGDPHITTAGGIHYDFQGAGEYVSLRNASGLEIQTRQAALPTAPPADDGYDGLDTCVSLNTAVAARVGSHRVTYEPKFSGEPDRRGFQPNPGGWPDQSDLQLRVDGELTTLGPAGRDLSGGGRIAKTVAPNGIEGLEIDFPDHNALYVTPGFYFKPYLFAYVARLPIMDTAKGAAPVSAPPESGLMAAVPPDSWLPLLPDGTSVGSMPEPLHDRYTTLYQNFGEKWRVNEKTSPSLFDYASGTSTETFTDRSWPPERPPCAIPGTIPPEPASEPVAQEACRQITGKNTHHDCIFDVGVTGNLGFAKTYLAQQQLLPGATETAVEDDKNPSMAGQSVTFTATVAPAVSRSQATPTGTVQFTLDGSNAGSPLTLDSNGRAAWSTSALTAGIHQVAANYIPSANSLYLASVSPYERHVVLEPFNWYLWRAILLLIIV